MNELLQFLLPRVSARYLIIEKEQLRADVIIPNLKKIIAIKLESNAPYHYRTLGFSEVPLPVRSWDCLYLAEKIKNSFFFEHWGFLWIRLRPRANLFDPHGQLVQWLRPKNECGLWV